VPFIVRLKLKKVEKMLHIEKLKVMTLAFSLAREEKYYGIAKLKIKRKLRMRDETMKNRSGLFLEKEKN